MFYMMLKEKGYFMYFNNIGIQRNCSLTCRPKRFKMREGSTEKSYLI